MHPIDTTTTVVDLDALARAADRLREVGAEQEARIVLAAVDEIRQRRKEAASRSQP